MNNIDIHLERIKEAADVIAASLPKADFAIVLGSGLGAFADALEKKQKLSYRDIPHFPQPSIIGHSGELIWGKLGDVSVLALSGRFHYYEGHDPLTVVLPVRVLHQLGIKSLILTNAAGGVNPHFKAGDLMLISDHINLSGYNPLRGENIDLLGPPFS